MSGQKCLDQYIEHGSWINYNLNLSFLSLDGHIGCYFFNIPSNLFKNPLLRCGGVLLNSMNE